MNKYTIIKKHQREKLLEFTAQELVQNKGIDQQNIENKSEFVQRSVGIVSWIRNNNIITFFIKSFSREPSKHKTSIMFDGMKDLKNSIQQKKIDVSDPVKLRAAIQQVVRSDIKVHCTCESYQYYRSYQLTQLDAAIIPEDRPPKRNDPNLKRSHLCHHLLSSIRYIMKFEQHVIEYLMKHEPLLIQSFDKNGITINDAIVDQLRNLIDNWSGKIADILNDPSIKDELSRGIKDILNKKNLKLEKRIIKEQVDINSLIANVNKFVEYVVNNFVDKTQRPSTSAEIKSFIQNIVEDNEEVKQFEQEQEKIEEPDIEEQVDNIPFKEYAKRKISDISTNKIKELL